MNAVSPFDLSSINMVDYCKDYPGATVDETFAPSLLLIPKACDLSKFESVNVVNSLDERDFKILTNVVNFFNPIDFWDDANPCNEGKLEILPNTKDSDYSGLEVSIIKIFVPNSWKNEKSLDKTTFVLSTEHTDVPFEYLHYESNDACFAEDLDNRPKFTFTVSFTGLLNPETLHKAYQIFLDTMEDNGMNPIHDYCPWASLKRLQGNEDWQAMTHSLITRSVTPDKIEDRDVGCSAAAGDGNS